MLDVVQPIVLLRVLAALNFPPVPETIWTAWNLAPTLLVSLLGAAVLYARAVAILWRRAGAGRGVDFRRVVAFGLGLVILFVALISPLDALSEALLSAHMVQHLLLIVVAAPLLVVGAPPLALMWALPRPLRLHLPRWWHQNDLLQQGWGIVSHPLAVWVLHAAALSLWHLPRFYQAALLNEAVHVAEHATFLAVGFLFWWTIAYNDRFSVGVGALLIFTTALFGGFIGALLTFSTQLWYPVYTVHAYAWGTTPLEDQQLAGVLMWWAGGLLYVAAAILLLGRWFYRQEKAEARREAEMLPLPSPPET